MIVRLHRDLPPKSAIFSETVQESGASPGHQVFPRYATNLELKFASGTLIPRRDVLKRWFYWMIQINHMDHRRSMRLMFLGLLFNYSFIILHNWNRSHHNVRNINSFFLFCCVMIFPEYFWRQNYRSRLRLVPDLLLAIKTNRLEYIQNFSCEQLSEYLWRLPAEDILWADHLW